MCGVQHKYGITVPAGVATGGGVVDAGWGEEIVPRRRQYMANGMGGDVGQQVGSGGRADLVGYHGQAFAFLGQAQHGLGEVAAARAIDTTGAQNQVRHTGGGDSLAYLNAPKECMEVLPPDHVRDGKSVTDTSPLGKFSYPSWDWSDGIPPPASYTKDSKEKDFSDRAEGKVRRGPKQK